MKRVIPLLVMAFFLTFSSSPGVLAQPSQRWPEDKANADTIMGMEVQGLAIPAFGRQMGATVSSRELRRRSGGRARNKSRAFVE